MRRRICGKSNGASRQGASCEARNKKAASVAAEMHCVRPASHSRYGGEVPEMPLNPSVAPPSRAVERASVAERRSRSRARVVALVLYWPARLARALVASRAWAPTTLIPGNPHVQTDNRCRPEDGCALCGTRQATGRPVDRWRPVGAGRSDGSAGRGAVPCICGRALVVCPTVGVSECLADAPRGARSAQLDTLRINLPCRGDTKDKVVHSDDGMPTAAAAREARRS